MALTDDDFVVDEKLTERTDSEREIDPNRGIRRAKLLAITGFLVLLFSTYYIRSEVLTLNTIRFSASNAKSDEHLKELAETYPERTTAYDAQMKQYDIELEHYKKMLHLYKTDYKTYVKRRQDHYSPPQLPRKPEKPKSVEFSDKLARINAEFRRQQHNYFKSARRLNRVSCLAALTLVGSLLYLLMFDIEGKRGFYIVILVLSFVFMIGTSFHSILSAIVGMLRPPGMY